MYPYPCGCNSQVVYSTPAPKSCDNCLFVPSITLADNAAFAACGSAGQDSTVELANLPDARLEAGGTLTWQILHANEYIYNPSIGASTGIVTFRISETADPKKGHFGEILVRAVGSTGLSVIAKITIPVHNPCLNKICLTDQVCNKCTGNCEAITQDIIVS